MGAQSTGLKCWKFLILTAKAEELAKVLSDLTLMSSDLNLRSRRPRVMTQRNAAGEATNKLVGALMNGVRKLMPAATEVKIQWDTPTVYVRNTSTKKEFDVASINRASLTYNWHDEGLRQVGGVSGERVLAAGRRR